MIVPGMSLPEIGKAIFTDYEGEIRPKMKGAEVMYKRRWVQNGKKDYWETITIPAKSKNDWRMTIRATDLGVVTEPYLIHYDKVGLTAWYVSEMANPKGVMYFNTHFFKRYRERLKLDIEKPEALVKNFFRKNHNSIIPCYTTEEDVKQQLFVPLDGGVGLGIYHGEDFIFEFKTFVSNDMLKEEQLQQVRDIYTDVMNQMMEAFKHVKFPAKRPY
jgi:hypothetical protein